MSTSKLRLDRSAVRLLLVAAALSAALLQPAVARDKLGNSLDFVPADAAMYSMSLRNKEQLNILLQSKAWARLMGLPAVQMGREWVETKLAEPGNPAAMGLALLQLPENQQLLQLFGDMWSQEVFVYGDHTWPQFMNFMGQLNAVRYQGALADLRRQTGGSPGDAADNPARLILDTLDNNLELIAVPNLVMGFKLTDPQPAKTQLKRLEVLAGLFLQQVPMLKGRLKHVEIGKQDFLTFTVEGEMIPWEVFWGRVRQMSENPEEYDELLKTLKQVTLTVTMGVKDGYLLVGIGRSNEALERLGTGKLLVDERELKPLGKYLDKRLTGVMYVSTAMQAETQVSKDDIDHWAELAADFLGEAPLEDELRQRAEEDIKRLAKDLKRYLGTPASVLSLSFLTDRGIEFFKFDRSQNLLIDTSKPLSLTSHLGGAPLAAVVSRSKDWPKQCELLLDWVSVLHGYFEEIAVKQMPEHNQAEYTTFRDAFLPLVKRAGAATRTMLIPGLAEGQGGLVLDAKIKSQQWQKQMPKSPTPLPMLEIGIIFAVRDEDLVRKALAEYKTIADEVLVKLKELGLDEIPADFKLPGPTSQVTKDGTVEFFALPREAELDPQIAPSGGLNKQVWVMSTAPKHAARLLATTPLAADGPLAKADRPSGQIAYFSWPSLIDAVTPWVEYGVRIAAPELAEVGSVDVNPIDRNSFVVADSGRTALAEPLNDSEKTKFILEHVHGVAAALKALGTIESVTYDEDGVLVTHTEWHMKDID